MLLGEQFILNKKKGGEVGRLRLLSRSSARCGGIPGSLEQCNPNEVVKSMTEIQRYTYSHVLLWPWKAHCPTNDLTIYLKGCSICEWIFIQRSCLSA